MTTLNFTSGSAISQYVSSLLSQQQSTATGGSGSASPADAVRSKLTAAPTDFKTTRAQSALDDRQASLGKELLAGLAKAGVKLSGEVAFSVDSKGQLGVKGSEADMAKVADYLKQDNSEPSLQSRMADILQSADELAASTQQRNAISMAARYAAGPNSLMAMYSQFKGYQDATPAAFTLSGGSTALHYPGALSSEA